MSGVFQAANVTAVSSAIKIPRFIGASDQDSVFQVLVFCDTSTKSYGAAVHLHVVSPCGVFTNLVFCKMRLTLAVSKKKRKGQEVDEISLPRLELLGVLMGVRASNFVSRELKLPVKKGTFGQILSVFYTGLEQPSCYQYFLRTELRKLKEKQI